MYRAVYENLLEWKSSPERKPLIVEGVRQCGKTYVLQQFAKENYDHMAYVNFERKPSLASLFEGDIDPKTIIDQLSTILNRRIVPERTLIILDEIQNAPRALTAMKYFVEEVPEYHIVCAGSLLGLLTSKPDSFPVGKVDRIRMYPMSFREFLMANDRGNLAEYIGNMRLGESVPMAIHEEIMPLLNDYLVVGGMPAAVGSWVEHHKMGSVTRILRNIISDYRDDFSKHAGDDLNKVCMIWDSVPVQLAKENRKFFFKHVKEGSTAKSLEDALQWLVRAGLVYTVPCVESPATPLSGRSDNTSFKLYTVDVGILRVMFGRDPGVVLDDPSDDSDYRGALMENLVLCQMLCGGVDGVYYWRKGPDEVDFLIDGTHGPAPVEVKAGTKFKTRGLDSYRRGFDPYDAFLVSASPDASGPYTRLPLYCAEMIPLNGLGSSTGPISHPDQRQLTDFD